MWNSRKCTAMAVLGVGLAVAAATPASAWWPGAYGSVGGCGAYGSAVGYGGYGGCGGYGYAGGYGAYGGYGSGTYAGVYSYGWPYGIIGDYGYAPAAYGSAVGCGAYGSAVGYGGYGGYGIYGYAPVYYGYGGYGGAGYGYGGAGYGYGGVGYGYGCHARRHLHGHGGYALSYMPRHNRSGYAYAANTPRSSRHPQSYASAHSARSSSNFSLLRLFASVK